MTEGLRGGITDKSARIPQMSLPGGLLPTHVARRSGGHLIDQMRVDPSLLQGQSIRELDVEFLVGLAVGNAPRTELLLQVVNRNDRSDVDMVDVLVAADTVSRLLDDRPGFQRSRVKAKRRQIHVFVDIKLVARKFM
jgi:hypothetical protein